MQALLLKLILLDTLIKVTVPRFLNGYNASMLMMSISIIPCRNSGMTFGLFQGSNNTFIILNFVFIVIFSIYMRKNIGKIWFTLILAGGISNLMDRILFGAVLDYISFSFSTSWNIYYTPTFNLADIMIFLGVLIHIIRK